jgi:hypothetical protein
MAEDILELKFDGNNISPDVVKPSEIANLIDSFEKILLNTIQANHPEINTDALLFSFKEIDDKSLDLKFIPRAAHEIVIATYLLVATCVKESNFQNLPVNTINPFKSITKFSKKYNCTGYFNHNNITVSSFSPDKEINFEKTNFITGETTIYGEVIDAGGENPNVHFKINNDYTIIFDVTREFAKAFAQKLYEGEIGIKGIAKWDVTTYKVDHFKPLNIIEYEPRPINETFDDLKSLIGKYWDQVDDIDTILG